MRRFVVCLAVVVASCGTSGSGSDAGDAGSGDAATADGDVASVDADADDAGGAAMVNGWELQLEEESGVWSLVGDDGSEVVSGAGAKPPVRVATGKPGVKSEFGAFRIAMTGRKSNLDWRKPKAGSPTLESSGEGWDVVWPLGDGAAVRLEFRAADGADVRVRVRTSGIEADAAELSLACADGESYFGLGTQVTGLDLRGRTYPLWTQEQGVGKPEDGGIFPINQPPEAAYAPMGVWHSTAGYSALVDHDSYSELDVCSEGGPLRLRSYRKMPSVTLDLEGTPKERVERVTHYTGRLQERPPAWVFGTWLTSVGGPSRLDDVAKTARQEGIAASAIWSEDWIGWDGMGSNRRLTYSWKWDDKHYPMLPSRVEELHDNGFAFLGYFNSFVPKPTEMWGEGKKKGYLIRDAEGEVVTFKDPGTRTASLVDLSKPKAVEWLQGYQKRAVSKVGLDGWMADFSEWYPLEAEPTTDVSSWEFHNRYPVAWARANRGTLEATNSTSATRGERVFFARSGWASTKGGSGGVAPAMWAGDQQTNWKRNDGLPSVVPIVAHAGLSGVAIMGSDIGGYSTIATDHRSKELYVRWAEMAAFHPLMRAHHGDAECKNWSFDRDQETLDHLKRYAAIHALLYPYLEGLLDEAMESGLPLARHPWLVEPDKESLWSGDDWLFFLGDDLLVAPVMEKGSDKRAVELPSRAWWPLFGVEPAGKRASKTRDVVRLEASAPVTEIPVYVRPGTVLPLLSEPVDSHYGASKQGVTDLADVGGSYRVAIYPDGSGKATLEGVDGLAVEAEGFSGAPDIGSVTVKADGKKLAACASAGNGESCVDVKAGLVKLRDVKSADLEVAQATISVTADDSVDLTIGFGGDAWGKWAEATAMDVDADAPSHCD